MSLLLEHLRLLVVDHEADKAFVIPRLVALPCQTDGVAGRAVGQDLEDVTFTCNHDRGRSARRSLTTRASRVAHEVRDAGKKAMMLNIFVAIPFFCFSFFFFFFPPFRLSRSF